MIKRRFYKLEHGDKDIASDSSSSSSDSEHDADAKAESEESEEEVSAEVKENGETNSISSGYESEDSSANEVEVDSAGLENDNSESEDDQETFSNQRLQAIHYDEMPKMKFSTPVQSESFPDGFPPCILKCKKVFKCKICPRIVLLNEDTMRIHLKSKGHARSEKLLKENRLKVMLNSDGELEEQDVDEEEPPPVTFVKDKSKKKKKEGPYQRKGSKPKRTREEKESKRDGAKKRHKNED